MPHDLAVSTALCVVELVIGVLLHVFQPAASSAVAAPSTAAGRAQAWALGVVCSAETHLSVSAACFATTLVGLCVAASFYLYNARVVFNSDPPPLWRNASPFWTLLPFLRPLQIVWRFATFPLRVLPDVYVVGETRCGTTSLCEHLRTHLGARGPFTPWDMPLANKKESFYLVGHYWGLVHPALYRMAFPTRLEVWFRRRLLRQPFHVFDGCASYLTAPWVAGLVHRVTPDARIVICLREPVGQNESWWRLEQRSMGFARNVLRLPAPPPCAGNTALPSGLSARASAGAARRQSYPPATLQEAFALSKSQAVATMYREAEAMCSPGGPGPRCDVPDPRKTSVPWFLPDWALPFPNGQLAAFASMGRYAVNVKRYLDRFGPARVAFVDAPRLTTDVRRVLRDLRCLLGLRRPGLPGCEASRLPRDVPVVRLNGVDEDPERSAAAAAAAAAAATPDGARAPPHSWHDRPALRREMARYYAPWNAELERLTGLRLGWNELPAYSQAASCASDCVDDENDAALEARVWARYGREKPRWP